MSKKREVAPRAGSDKRTANGGNTICAIEIVIPRSIIGRIRGLTNMVERGLIIETDLKTIQVMGRVQIRIIHDSNIVFTSGDS